MGRLDGKTAAVTGAGRGIGAEYAKKLASEGANVIVTDILDTSDTVEAIKAAGRNAVGMTVDVTSDDDLNAMVAKAESEFGALNILVNNAGLFANLTPKPFFQIDNDEFDKVMTINARSIRARSRACLRRCRSCTVRRKTAASSANSAPRLAMKIPWRAAMVQSCVRSTCSIEKSIEVSPTAIQRLAVAVRNPMRGASRSISQ